MSLSVLGIGTANPPHTMNQRESAKLAVDVCQPSSRQERLLKVLYKKAGVENRYTVLPHRIATEWIDPESEEFDPMGPTTAQRMEFYQEHALPLARTAATEALEDSGLDTDKITHLVTVSCTGFRAPGFDIDLITGLRLPADVQRVHVGFMGCHGAINGLRTALAFAQADPSARILLCAAECCSIHYRFQWDPDRFLGNALFADGAAALVCRGGGQGSANGNGSAKHISLQATGSSVIPDSEDSLTWDIGNHGFEMFLSPAVPELIESNLRKWLTSWLAGQNLSLSDIGGWAVHPGGPRILQAVQNCLQLSNDDLSVSRHILATYGNMSSPTILFILNQMRLQQQRWPCVALGFGPGLTAEAALFT